MPTYHAYHVYRDSGKIDDVTADIVRIERDTQGAIAFYVCREHSADQDCACERYNRHNDDGERIAHRSEELVAAYAGEYWRRVERVDV